MVILYLLLTVLIAALIATLFNIVHYAEQFLEFKKEKTSIIMHVESLVRTYSVLRESHPEIYLYLSKLNKDHTLRKTLKKIVKDAGFLT